MRYEVCQKTGRLVYLPSSEADVNSRAAQARPGSESCLSQAKSSFVALKDPTARRTLLNSTQTFLLSSRKFD